MVHDVAYCGNARWLGMLLLLFGLWSAGPAQAEGRPPIHVQIVLDSSGSMIKNDPRRLSSLAGMIFTDLAGPEDHVGVLSMRKGRFVEEKLTPAGAGRKRLRQAIRKLPFNGPTYCAEPLEKAAEGLEALRGKQPDARQFVIFLSDGACPNDHQRGPEDVRLAARQLGDEGVKVFSIGLFGDPTGGGTGDPTADLRTMASVTAGEFFSASKAADLPQRFAAILGRIVGSEAQEIELTAGQDVAATLDGYSYDAAFIATGTAKAVVIDDATTPDGTSLELPGRSSHSETGQNYYVASWDNDSRRQYSVLRIDKPAAGKWTFRVDGPPNLKALLIQNYALDPVVELGKTKQTYALGDTIDVSAWLRGGDGERVTDAAFLKKVEFTIDLAPPKGESRTLLLKPDESGAFTGKIELDVPGEWGVRGRAKMRSGGLDKRTVPASFEVVAPKIALADGSAAIDLGEVKAGTTTVAHTIDLGGSVLPRSHEVSLSTGQLKGVKLKSSDASLTSQNPTVDVEFTVLADHAGGALNGELLIQLDGTGQQLSVPVTGTVVPLTFWEKWGRLVIVIGAGVLGLGLLIFIVLGFTRPHRFPPDSRIHWGDSIERLNKNELVISEMKGTSTGFYRNARLRVGGAGHELAVGGVHVATIWMESSTRIMIRGENVELRKVNKFDDSKTKAVDDNECSLETGEIFQAGELYLRIV